MLGPIVGDLGPDLETRQARRFALRPEPAWTHRRREATTGTGFREVKAPPLIDLPPAGPIADPSPLHSQVIRAGCPFLGRPGQSSWGGWYASGSITKARRLGGCE